MLEDTFVFSLQTASNGWSPQLSALLFDKKLVRSHVKNT